MARLKSPRAPADGQPNATNRNDRIVYAAARLFATHGFDGTSMRDIAEASGILAGSLYHHFRSKADLFMAAHEAGVDVQERAVREALAGVTDPWERLAVAAAAHCAMLLEGEPVNLSTPRAPASMLRHNARLLRRRDTYEQIFVELVDALPLPPQADRQLFRLHFLGALNWVPQWYRKKGRLRPAEIGHGLVDMLRGWPAAAAAAAAKPRPRRPRTASRELAR